MNESERVQSVHHCKWTDEVIFLYKFIDNLSLSLGN